jgi:transcriptional regulator with XRE-family HTH domain
MVIIITKILCKFDHMNNLNNISALILHERKQQGWSQQQLANYVGLNRTTIGSIERGDYSDIGIRKIEKILNLFNKSLTIKDVGLPTLDQLKELNKQGY